MQKTPDFPMPITTDRLIIRPTQSADAKILNEAILESYDELHFWMEWANHQPDLRETEKLAKEAADNWIDKKNDEPYLQLVILDRNTNAFIGGTGFHHYNWEIPSIETGYWIRKSKSGHGYITEATNAITQYAFKQLQVKRIALTCDPDNIKSKSIAERLGYILEGKSISKSTIDCVFNEQLYPKFNAFSRPDLYQKLQKAGFENKIPKEILQSGSFLLPILQVY